MVLPEFPSDIPVTLQLGTGRITFKELFVNVYFYVSSSLIKEVAHFGGNVTGLVPAKVEEQLINRLKERPLG